MTMLGLVMLVGIVVNNGIILVDCTNLLISRGKKKMEACLEAGVSRFRPVLMTTLTTVLGMLPMSFNSSGSAAMVQPIGLCVLGGLISSTFVTLVLIPVLYSLIMGENKEKQVSIALASGKMPAMNIFNDKKAFYRCEIIANMSVEEDITELLEAEIESIQYTVAEQIYGRGLKSRKLGNTVWAETNFVLITYIEKEELENVKRVVESVKEKFRTEGIQMFIAKI